jgi:hypothetical protein
MAQRVINVALFKVIRIKIAERSIDCSFKVWNFNLLSKLIKLVVKKEDNESSHRSIIALTAL